MATVTRLQGAKEFSKSTPVSLCSQMMTYLYWKVIVTLLLGLQAFGKSSVYNRKYKNYTNFLIPSLEQHSTSYPPNRVSPLSPPIEPASICGANVELSLTRTGLQRISRGSITSLNVIKLYVDDNNINEIPCDAFDTVPNLQILNVSANNLSTARLLSFGMHKSLLKLYLDDNKYYGENMELTEFCGSLPKLQELYLRRNGISHFGIALTTFAPGLKRLHLDGNKIKSVDFFVNIPTTLTHLHMDDNQVSGIKDSQLRNLEELSVSGNLFTTMCRSNSDKTGSSAISLISMDKLKKLNVSRNNISDIAEDTFVDTTQLKSLDLSGNRIKELPSNVFKGLMELTELLLSHNLLNSVPETIQLLKRLKHLDLTGNQIITVSFNNFVRLLELDTLLLANNYVTTIHVPSSQIKLRTLDLSNNLLMDLPVGLITYTSGLEVLRLRNNSIANLDQLLKEASYTIRELHLQDNPLLQLNLAKLQRTEMRNLVLHLKDADTSPCKDDEISEKEENESNEL